MMIDKFLTSYEGKEEVKYRFWDSKKINDIFKYKVPYFLYCW